MIYLQLSFIYRVELFKFFFFLISNDFVALTQRFLKNIIFPFLDKKLMPTYHIKFKNYRKYNENIKITWIQLPEDNYGEHL